MAPRPPQLALEAALGIDPAALGLLPPGALPGPTHPVPDPSRPLLSYADYVHAVHLTLNAAAGVLTAHPYGSPGVPATDGRSESAKFETRYVLPTLTRHRDEVATAADARLRTGPWAPAGVTVSFVELRPPEKGAGRAACDLELTLVATCRGRVERYHYWVNVKYSKCSQPDNTGGSASMAWSFYGRQVKQGKLRRTEAIRDAVLTGEQTLTDYVFWHFQKPPAEHGTRFGFTGSGVSTLLSADPDAERRLFRFNDDQTFPHLQMNYRLASDQLTERLAAGWNPTITERRLALARWWFDQIRQHAFERFVTAGDALRTLDLAAPTRADDALVLVDAHGAVQPH